MFVDSNLSKYGSTKKIIQFDPQKMKNYLKINPFCTSFNHSNVTS